MDKERGQAMPIQEESPLCNFPDHALRELLQYPDHLASVLRRAFPALAGRFDCARAAPVKSKFALEDWRERESDLLFLVPFRAEGAEREVLVCVLLEHQSESDARMPLRMILYAALFWDQEWKRWE